MKLIGKYVGVSILSVAIVAIALSSCSKGGGAVEKHIVKDASFVLLVPNMGKAIANVDSFLTWAATKTPAIAMVKQNMVNELGFDLANMEELKKRGIDPDGGMAFVMTDPKAAKGYMVIAVKSEKDLVAAINDGNSKKGKPALSKKDDGYDLGEDGLLIFKKGFAYIGDDKALIDRAIDGDSISGDEAFKTARKNVGDGTDAFVYVSPAFLKSAVAKSGELPAESAKALETVSKLYGAMGVGLKIAKGDVEAKTYVEILDMTKVKKLMSTTSGSKMLAKMPEGASILLRTHTNMMETWNFMKEFLASSDPNYSKQISAGLEEANKALGMDVEKDLLGNIEGNPTVAYYGTLKGAGGTPDLVVTMTLKDGGKIKAALVKLAQMATGKAPTGEVVEFPMGPGESMFITVSGGNLVAATSSPRLADSTSDSGAKAVATVPHAEAKKLLEDVEKDVLYVNVASLVQSIKKGLSPQEGQMIDMYVKQAGGVDDAYILVSYSIVEKGIVGGIKIHLGN